MSETSPGGADAGAALLRKDYFAVVASGADGATAEALQARLPAHLEWIGELEQAGTLFMAGPLLSGPGVRPGAGLIILRAASEEAARVIAEDDPLVRAGLRTSAVHRWQLNEGSISLRLTLSRAALDWQ